MHPIVVTQVCRLLIKFCGPLHVLRHAAADIICITQLVHRVGIAEVGGLAVPVRRLRRRHANGFMLLPHLPPMAQLMILFAVGWRQLSAGLRIWYARRGALAFPYLDVFKVFRTTKSFKKGFSHETYNGRLLFAGRSYDRRFGDGAGLAAVAGRGATRVGDFKVPAAWPKELTAAWRVNAGNGGDSSPALVGDKLFLITRQGDEEAIVCLDTAKGTEVWRDKYATPAVSGPDAKGHAGPRSSPAVADGKVVAAGSQWRGFVSQCRPDGKNCVAERFGERRLWRAEIPHLGFAADRRRPGDRATGRRGQGAGGRL